MIRYLGICLIKLRPTEKTSIDNRHQGDLKWHDWHKSWSFTYWSLTTTPTACWILILVSLCNWNYFASTGIKLLTLIYFSLFKKLIVLDNCVKSNKISNYCVKAVKVSKCNVLDVSLLLRVLFRNIKNKHEKLITFISI